MTDQPTDQPAIHFVSLQQFIVPVRHTLETEKMPDGTLRIIGPECCVRALKADLDRQEARRKCYCKDTAIWGCHCGAKENE